MSLPESNHLAQEIPKVNEWDCLRDCEEAKAYVADVSEASFDQIAARRVIQMCESRDRCIGGRILALDNQYAEVD